MQEVKFNSFDFSDEDLVNASTETIGSGPSQRSLWAQAELTRRSMKSIRDFDRTTSEYSKKILNLTLVLLLIGLAQLMIGVFALPFPLWVRIISWLVLVLFIVRQSWELTHTQKQKGN